MTARLLVHEPQLTLRMGFEMLNLRLGFSIEDTSNEEHAVESLSSSTPFSHHIIKFQLSEQKVNRLRKETYDEKPNLIWAGNKVIYLHRAFETELRIKISRNYKL
ncbi:hypothetical protein Zmor_013577 [Zophobas morio]|uniref:Uncharacterized protein n=1 Tax=Zophobas morio TaxID=2755281 RepID=A0AA38IHW6_9CUCU|nr:hypothetical protein Zmor_013577 [Zophobas morio]